MHYALSLNGNVKLTGEFYALKPGLVKEIPRVVNDDLYIEYSIKKQGYKIKQALNAISYMNGPETLKDFLTQRIRVHIGHYQIARMTGYVPQTIKTGEILKKNDENGRLEKDTLSDSGDFFGNISGNYCFLTLSSQ